jgi:sarcosine oxidase subunit delta
MLQLDCPWCGVRDEDEFRYGGEAGAIRPALDADDERWSDYLFNRSNAKGVHEERWQHAYGCGRWFSALRDTVTHEVHATYRFGEPRPSGDSVS